MIVTNFSEVDANEVHEFNKVLRASLAKAFEHPVEHVSFEEIRSSNIPPRSIIVTTIELEDPLLANMTNTELQAIKTMTDNASILFWVTGGSLFKSHLPMFSLVLGLARSLMLERPSFKIPVLDLDKITDD